VWVHVTTSVVLWIWVLRLYLATRTRDPAPAPSAPDYSALLGEVTHG
jgi:hypothetical protein